MPSDEQRDRLLSAQRALGERYRATLAGDAAFFEHCLVEGNVHFEAVRRRAHRIRGAAGSFGFHELTEVAGLVDDADEGEQAERCARLIEVLYAVARARPRGES